METLQSLIENNLVSIARLPKGNMWALEDGRINFDKINALDGLIVYTIEKDYAGSSVWMQNYTLNNLGIDTIRSIFLVVSRENSKQLYQTLKSMDNYLGGGAGSGLKEAVLDYMDDLDDSARDLKSVNAIVKENGSLVGFNTDGLGYRISLEKYLEERDLNLSGTKFAILGAGGVALPVIYELRKLNPSSISIVNRTQEKAKIIADEVNSILGKNIVISMGEDNTKLGLENASLVVNLSNKGQDGAFENYCAFAQVASGMSIENHYAQAKENISVLNKGAIVSDIILSKGLTKTLDFAKRNGFQIQDGSGMVLEQGVPAFRRILKSSNLSTIPDEFELHKYMSEALRK